MAHIVYTAKLEDGTPNGSLFAGKKLFLTQKTPSRSHFIDLIRANGGEVVKLEKSADIIIADDARKEVVPGSYSYKWIDNSIKNGALEDLDDYLAGPPVGIPRAMGSTIRPAKNSRNFYSAEDDRILLEWVQVHGQKGASMAGNETYKKLEAQHPRHSWQSWRDRWVKTLRFRAPLPSPPQEAALASRDVNDTRSPKPPQSRAKKTPISKSVLAKPTDLFTDEDINTLRALTPSILEIHPEREDEAWNEWAQLHPEHSAERWRTFWRKNILPIARHSSGEIIVKDEEIASQELTPVTSPSLRSQSSHAVQKSFPIPRQTKGKVTSTLTSPLKRKRPMEESDGPDIPSSPPVIPRGLSLTAVSPYQKRPIQMQEVPSTPESEKPITERPSPTPIYPYVKDTLEEMEHHSIEADEFLESGRELSPTLSEPQTRRKGSASTPNINSPMADLNSDTLEDDITLKYPRLRDSGIETTYRNNTILLDHEDDDFEYRSNVQITYPDLPQPEQRVAADTQAILQEEAPRFDFDLPDPEEGWQVSQSSPPPMPSSSKRSKRKGKERMVVREESENRQLGAANDDEGLAQLATWINAKLEQGYAMVDIQTAMSATTMNMDLANNVLRYLKRTGDIPANTPGIWTPSDDDKMVARDAREIHMLQEKHGNDSFNQRWEFLQTYHAVVQSGREGQGMNYEG